MMIDLQDFEDQITELINGVETVLTSEISRLKGTERVEVII